MNFFLQVRLDEERRNELITTTIVLIPHPNHFHVSLRPSQPRNDSKLHKAVLLLQAFLVFIAPDIAFCTMYQSSMRFVIAGVRTLFGAIVLPFGFRNRTKISQLPQKRLSRFLTDNLLVPMFTFAGAAIFFALDPIRCWLENSGVANLKLCDRTLLGQSGLSLITLIHFTFSNLTSIFSPTVTTNHHISFYKIATADLSFREVIKLTVQLVVICCAFFLFSMYNARGKMGPGEVRWSEERNEERNDKITEVKSLILTPFNDLFAHWPSQFEVLICTGLVGAMALAGVGFWEYFSMERETKIEDEVGEGDAELVVSERNKEQHLTKLHRGFRIFGLLTSATNFGTATLGAITLEKNYSAFASIIFPFVLLTFIVALLSNPREQKKAFGAVLFVAFASAELPTVVWNVRIGSTAGGIDNVVRLLGWVLLSHFGGQIRKKIGQKTDEELSNFFLDSLLSNLFNILLGILFVTFRSMNCVVAETSLEMCSDTILCGSILSDFIVGFGAIKVRRSKSEGSERCELHHGQERSKSERAIAIFLS